MSAGFVSDSNAEIPEFVVVYLVEVVADATTLRLCTDATDFVHDGDTFTACGDALEVAMYEEREDTPPRGRIRAHNLTGEMMAAIRSLDPRVEATVTVKLVTSDEPDVVQASWTGAAIREVSYDSLMLDCEIAADNVVGVGTPAMSFDPAHFPAMHAKGR